MLQKPFGTTDIIVSGTPGVEAPDPFDRIVPWTLDKMGRPVPLQGQEDQANSGIVMSSTYAFNAALALAEMRRTFSGRISEEQK